jgi:hypothetical protein
MSEFDDLNRALDWHAERTIEIFCELEHEWPLTTWWVEEGHKLYGRSVC